MAQTNASVRAPTVMLYGIIQGVPSERRDCWDARSAKREMRKMPVMIMKIIQKMRGISGHMYLWRTMAFWWEERKEVAIEERAMVVGVP